MRSLEFYIEWVMEDAENRLLVVPGIHLRNEVIDEWGVDPELVVDNYSIAHYTYPEYMGKTLAFLITLFQLETY